MTPSPWWTRIQSADLLELRRRLIVTIRADFPALVDAEVEDVVQQAFTVLFQRREGVDPAKDGLFRYIKTVAKNNALDRIRTAKRRRGRVAQIAAQALGGSGEDVRTGTTAEAAAESAEESRRIWEFFCALDEVERLVVWCHVVEGKSIRAVAVELNLNWHRVAGMIEQAMRKLRAELER